MWPRRSAGAGWRGLGLDELGVDHGRLPLVVVISDRDGHFRPSSEGEIIGSICL
jgi:hypothetical protein